MTRPFDSARYAKLLKGLEVSVVPLDKVINGTSTRRFDPEYFQKQHLADESLVESRPGDFQSFADLGLKVDGSAFYPAIEDFYGTGELPFIRVANVDSVIDFDNCTQIPTELCDKFPTLCRVQPGDLVFTKGGSVARIGLVTQEAAASRDLIFLNTSKLSKADRVLLYLYSQTAFFNRMLLRSSSQTAQPHLTITLVRNLPALRADGEFKMKCVEIVERAFAERNEAISKMNEAETMLSDTLGLDNWEPPEPLAYTRPASEAFAAERLDAEFFNERYAAARKKIFDSGALEFISFGDLAATLTNGHTPLHHDLTVGEVPFLCAEHVTDFECHYDSDKRILLTQHNEELARTAVKTGDVLLTIKGRIGNFAIAENVPESLNINQDVALVRLNNRLPKWWVITFLNSRFGKWEVQQLSTGGINPFLGLSNVRKLVVPRFPDKMMKQIADRTRAKVHEARAARTLARHLLERAKRAVEIAIEQDEKAALDFLRKP